MSELIGEDESHTEIRIFRERLLGKIMVKSVANVPNAWLSADIPTFMCESPLAACSTFESSFGAWSKVRIKICKTFNDSMIIWTLVKVRVTDNYKLWQLVQNLNHHLELSDKDTCGTVLK